MNWQVCHQPDGVSDLIGAPVEVVSVHRFWILAWLSALAVRFRRPAGDTWIEAHGGRQ